MKAVKRARCECGYNSNVDGKNKTPKCPKCNQTLKLSSDWYVRGQHNGEMIFKNCGALKKDAEAYIASCVIAKRTGSIMPGAEPVKTWEDGLAEFEKAEMKASTREYYKYVLISLTEEFRGINLIDLTPERLSNFTQERKSQGLSARTIAGDIATVKRLFTLVTRNLSAKQYPRLHEAMLDIQKVEKPAINNYKDDFFTSEEIKTMIAEAPEHLALAIRIQIETGLRPGNVYSLQFSDIAEDGTITLQAERMKNGETFVTSISSSLLHAIKVYAMKNGYREYLFPSRTGSGHVHDMRSAWTTMCSKAKVTGTPHKLRHSFASIMLAQDVPLVVVSELMGHQDIGITKKRYGHLEHGKKRDVLADYRARLAL